MSQWRSYQPIPHIFRFPPYQPIPYTDERTKRRRERIKNKKSKKTETRRWRNVRSSLPSLGVVRPVRIHWMTSAKNEILKFIQDLQIALFAFTRHSAVFIFKTLLCLAIAIQYFSGRLYAPTCTAPIQLLSLTRLHQEVQSTMLMKSVNNHAQSSSKGNTIV